METADPTREPEILVYFARHYAHLGLVASAIRSFRRAAQAGFVCSPDTLSADPWLSPLRKHHRFEAFFDECRPLVRQAAAELVTHLPESAA